MDGLPVVRPATEADNTALVDLAASCPAEGAVGFCVDRAPNFFALNELEGERFEVGVVDGPDGPVGSISVSWRNVNINGDKREVTYVNDLKVHPSFRRQGIASALIRWARITCEQSSHDTPTLVTVPSGNHAIERLLADAAHDMPQLQPVGAVRVCVIPLLKRRRAPHNKFTVRRARSIDIDVMAELWCEVAPQRQFTTVHDGKSLERWIERAPGLSISDFLLAHRPDGRLAGFLGVWDQQSFKQTRVTSYSLPRAAMRLAFNVAAPFAGGTRLPRKGQQVRAATAVNLCVPPADIAVMRSLLLAAYGELRNRDYAFLTLGLGTSDPLLDAVSGLFAQTADTAVALGGGETPELDDRPVFHEIGLL
jgi:GNAT superfamily N-acetyltransferase